MGQMKILSVDDNPQNLKLIQLALEEQFEVLSNDGSESIESLLEQFKPDVLLLDIMLGNISGYDVCRQVRKSNICPNIIVIFVSSLSSFDDKMTAYAAGGDDYICKPIDLQVLEQKLISIEKRLEQQKDLEQQYESASKVAYSSMQQSSELGQLLAFFTDTANVSRLDELFNAIVQFVNGFGSHCVVEFRLDERSVQYPTEGLVTLESEILELGRNAKRMISFSNNLLLNSKHCSLLIKKLPQDEELLGRVRDHYAILSGIVESRLMLIESKLHQEHERAKAVSHISTALDSGLGAIKEELRAQENQAQLMMQRLESSMSLGLVSLGLSEDQEEALMGIVEETRERFDSMVGVSIKIDNEIRQIDRLLGNLT